MEGKVESGVQLFQRLKSRPKISNLHPIITNNHQDNPIIVEISDNECGVRTGFLMELLIRTILPETITVNGVGCKGCGAIIINTEHHFNLVKFCSLLKKIIKREINNKTSPISILEGSLERLTVLNCYCEQQLQNTILNIENILLNNEKIGLVVIDSTSAFYWSEKLSTSSSAFFTLQSYSSTLLTSLFSLVKEFNINLIYGNSCSDENSSVTFRVFKDKMYLENVTRIVFYTEKDEMKVIVITGNVEKKYSCHVGEVFTFF